MNHRSCSLLLILCLLCAMLSGCGSKAETTGTPTEASFGESSAEASAAEDSAGPVPSVSTAGTFSMPCNTSYGWDPYSCLCMENQAVMDLVYEGLFRLNSSFEAENVLCSSYEISTDGTVYAFHLQDALFSNGDELTAADVVYSMEKAALSPLYASRFKDVATYYADGLDTVIVQLNHPNDLLPNLFDFPIVPNLSVTTNALGTGPYVRNGTTNLIKNTKWWQGSGNLPFQSVTLFSSVSAEDTRDNFEIDLVHFVYNNPSASSAASFHCDYELWISEGTVMQYIGFNTKDGVMSDPSVRSAITYAVNRSEIAESVYHNFATAASLPLSAACSYYDESLAGDYTYNFSTACEKLSRSGSFYIPPAMEATYEAATGAQVLRGSLSTAGANPVDEEASPEPTPESPLQPTDEAGSGSNEEGSENESAFTYNNITMLVMNGNANRIAAATSCAKDLEAVGFTVTLEVLEYDEYIYTLNTGEYDLFYAEVTMTPDFDLREVIYGSLNYGGILSEELTALYEKSRENIGNRYELYECIMSNGYICPVLFENNAVYTTRGVFSGLNPSPDDLFYGIENITVN